MVIRSAIESDAHGLTALVQLMGYKSTDEQMVERLKKIINRIDHCLLVAEEDNQVVGFCHGYQRPLIEVDLAVEIAGLAVAENWQGKGVAKQLILPLEKWVKQQGISKIVLSSNTMREKAHGFYEHMGYTKVKMQFAFEKEMNPE